jgi:hypothetical protein
MTIDLAEALNESLPGTICPLDSDLQSPPPSNVGAATSRSPVERAFQMMRAWAKSSSECSLYDLAKAGR